MTCSGRIFSPPPPPPRETNSEALDNARGKQVMDNQPEPSVGQEAEQLLRILKRSDYKLVDQLNQTPSKISILSLLLCSEAHRNALLKTLCSAHVTQDISVA